MVARQSRPFEARLRWRLDLSAILLGICAAGLFSASVYTAQADNFGGPKDPPPKVCDTTNATHQQCVAENWLHEVNYSTTLVGDWRTALQATAPDWDGPTSMTLFMNDAYGPSNDVRAANVNDTGTNLWGWTRCQATSESTGSLPTAVPPYANGLNWCKPQRVYFNRAHEDIYNEPTEKKAVACHELGHTMGLRHRDAAGTSGLSCMKTTPWNGGSTWYPVPKSHDTNLLNFWYP